MYVCADSLWYLLQNASIGEASVEVKANSVGDVSGITFC